jgi:hypothetical protein
MYKEKDFYLPNNYCNNNKSNNENSQIFLRNFLSPLSNIPAIPEPFNDNINNSMKNNKCTKYRTSEFSKIINDESKLFNLEYLNTKCPSNKPQVNKLINSLNTNLNNNNTNVNINNIIPSSNLVGIHNKQNEHKYNTEVDIISQKNNRTICTDPGGWNGCEYNTYLKGPNAAAVQTDVHYYMSGTNDLFFDKTNYKEKNYWTNYTEISNISSNIPLEPIKNRLVDFTNRDSTPFMLEDVRVRKTKEPKLPECNNLFNNMTKRKNLFQST